MKRKCLQALSCFVLVIVLTASSLLPTAYAQTRTSASPLGDSQEEIYTLENELNVPDITIDDTKEDYYAQQDTYHNIQINGEERSNSFAQSQTSRAPFANDPNSAIYLDSNYLNTWLMVLGDNNEDWYYFIGTADSKVTVVFEQPTTGDYDIQLFRYELATGNLYSVAFSAYSGSMSEQLSYVCTDTTYYFLRVVPYIPASPASDYSFAVIISELFDSAEPDDNFFQANYHSGGINVSQTIDNPYDVDWFSFSTSNNEKAYISLSNIPSGATYGFIIYDNAMNPLGSFAASGNEWRLCPLSANSTYYAKVFSLNGGFSATQDYQLTVSLHSPTATLTPGGNEVAIINDNLYIDGNIVNLSGTLLHTSAQTIPYPPNTWISRQQSYSAIGGSVSVLNFYDIGHYTGAVLSSPVYKNISYDNAVVIVATNVYSLFSWIQYANGSHHSSGSHTFSVLPGTPDPATIIVIDATTGNVIDFPWLNALYLGLVGSGHVPKINGDVIQ